MYYEVIFLSSCENSQNGKKKKIIKKLKASSIYMWLFLSGRITDDLNFLLYINL